MKECERRRKRRRRRNWEGKEERSSEGMVAIAVCVLLLLTRSCVQALVSRHLLHQHHTRVPPFSRNLIFKGIDLRSLQKESSPYCRLFSICSKSNSIEPQAESPLLTIEEKKKLYRSLDIDLMKISVPAFLSLAADPIASIVDTVCVGRLGDVEQAAMGLSLSAQYSIAKLYNDPLLKTSTSLVAGKTGDELEASVATALVSSVIIGFLQLLLFAFASGPILSLMGVPVGNEMRKPALKFLWWGAMGVPATTVMLVANGIFRGCGDTQTPLYSSLLGTFVNVVLDPLFVFTFNMGCAGASAATAIAQWASAIPLIWILHKRIVPIRIMGRDPQFYKDAFKSYLEAGVLLTLRSFAKISAYAVTSSAAARLGTIPMAAFSLTFNLGFAASQLCESISVAAQAILAREYPFQRSRRGRVAAAHVIRRALLLGFVVSSVVALAIIWKQDLILGQLTKAPTILETARVVMPMVLLTQLVKGLSYSTGGILLGGLDWMYSSTSMIGAALTSVITLIVLPRLSGEKSSVLLGNANGSWLTNGGKLTIKQVWQSLFVFMGMQVVVALVRVFSGTGPWANLPLLSDSKETAPNSTAVGDSPVE